MNSNETTGFFRCRIQDEHACALLRSGRMRIRASIQEASIEGFTVLVGARDSRKLKVGRPWILEHEGTVIEVHPQWFFNSPEGDVQIGVKRLRDLTPPPDVRKSLLVKYGGARYANPNVSATVFGGFVLLLFTILSLPGFGDKLGTSQRIQAAMKWFVGGVEEIVQEL